MKNFVKEIGGQHTCHLSRMLISLQYARTSAEARGGFCDRGGLEI